MNKKRCLLIGLLAVVVAAGLLGGLALLPPGPGVTRENAETVKAGMTRAQVSAIFGQPVPENVPSCAFESDAGRAAIAFDDNGLVDHVFWRDYIDERTAWEKLIDHLLHRESPRNMVITR